MQAGPVVRPGMAQVGSCRVAPCLDVLWIAAAAAAGEMLERPAEARSDDVSLAPGHVLDRPADGHPPQAGRLAVRPGGDAGAVDFVGRVASWPWVATGRPQRVLDPAAPWARLARRGLRAP